MQQTEKYKLNLIEPSDPFLPDSLNANTQRVEEVLQAHMEAPIAALDQRVTVLEGHKFAYGFNTGGSTFVELGFRPRAVLTQTISSTRTIILATENPTHETTIILEDTGFRFHPANPHTDVFYIAFA